MFWLAHFTHFFNQEGTNEFSRWFNHLGTVLCHQAGFLSIYYAHDPIHTQFIHLWIKFKDQHSLSNWVGSSKFQLMEEQLTPFKIQTSQREYYEIIDDISVHG